MNQSAINERISQLTDRLQQGERGHSLVPLLVDLATKLETSDNPRWHDDARRIRSGIQSIHRGGQYGGFVPNPV